MHKTVARWTRLVTAAVRCTLRVQLVWTVACSSEAGPHMAAMSAAEGQAGAHSVGAGAAAAQSPSASGAHAAGRSGTSPAAAAGAGAAVSSSAGMTAQQTPSAGANALQAGVAGGTLGAGTGGAALGGMAGVTPGAAAASGAAASPAVVDTPATCPATPTLKAGQTSRTLQSGKYMRKYLVYAPASYKGTTPVPVVFDFHGYSSSPQGQLGASGFRELADQEGFIGVYPEGIGASWNVNGCCGQAGEEQLDEIAFVRSIVDELKKDACVDPKRIYATGISQGGGMAHHVACLAADIFAAVAPVSSDLRTEPCMPARPISELSFRGEADSLDAYEGGHVGPPGMEGYTAIGAKATLERWKTIDMCSGTPVMMNEHCETYTACAAGTEVSLCSIPGGDHVLYRNPVNLNLPKVAWELFKKHPL